MGTSANRKEVFVRSATIHAQVSLQFSHLLRRPVAASAEGMAGVLTSVHS
jgi:hypothetical protein